MIPCIRSGLWADLMQPAEPLFRIGNTHEGKTLSTVQRLHGAAARAANKTEMHRIENGIQGSAREDNEISLLFYVLKLHVAFVGVAGIRASGESSKQS